MKKYILLILFFFLNQCNTDTEKCGQIIQKVVQGSTYLFVLQTDDYGTYYADQDLPGVPDDGVRQGAVSKEVYEAFEVGDEFCAAD